MIHRCCLVFVAVILVAADKKTETVDKELKALQGEWKLVKAEAGGKQIFGEKEKVVVVIKDDLLTMTSNGAEDMKAKFKIDPATKLKSMDWATKRGDMPIDVPLIYSLEGDDLKIVMPLVEKGKGETPKRPETFDTKDKPLMLFILKRVKK
jgi:uncharacterized protein (TIGR03067 family)